MSKQRSYEEKEKLNQRTGTEQKKEKKKKKYRENTKNEMMLTEQERIEKSSK